MFKGSCLCGKVRYQTTELQGPYVHCHCSSCRKASGSAFAANIAAPGAAFTVLEGHDLLKSFESSPDKHRHFCSHCGSPLYTTVGRDPKMVRIRLGTLDTEYAEPCAAHIFVAENPQWHVIADDAPQFEGWPDPNRLSVPGSRQRLRSSTARADEEDDDG